MKTLIRGLILSLVFAALMGVVFHYLNTGALPVP